MNMRNPLNLKSLKVIALIILSLLISNQCLKSQSFSLNEIDTSQFPLIKAGFTAIQGDGSSYQNLTPDDFNVLDNGKNVNSTVKIQCDKLNGNSIVLAIDQSGSMNDWVTPTEKKKDWLKQGIRAFIEAIDFQKDNEVAICGFGGYSEVKCPFSQDSLELSDSLDFIIFGGQTDFNCPFLGGVYDKYLTGEGSAVEYLKIMSPPAKRRIIIFVTDGKSYYPMLTQRIIDSLKAADVLVYAITLGEPMNTELALVANSTGGKTYEIYTKQELRNIYEIIALNLNQQVACEISWQSDYPCSESGLIHQAQITFKKISGTISKVYTAPLSSVAKVETGGDIISFGSPDPGNSYTNKIVFMPITAPFTIDTIFTQPDTYFKIIDWGGAEKSHFTINAGESRTFTIQFTQQNAKYLRQALLITQGTPCPPVLTLMGGNSFIKVIRPNGGEEYEVDSLVNIKWVSNNADNIKIEFTSDLINWNITEPSISANQIQSEWKIPNVISDSCKIRLTCLEDNNIIDVSDSVFKIVAKVKSVFTDSDLKDKLKIEFTKNMIYIRDIKNYNNIQVRITDILGNIILCTDSEIIDITQLGTGCYMLLINYNKDKIIKKFLVIN
jgi:hypothetical protein